MTEKTSIVVTSIFSPNTALKLLAKGAVKNGWDFVIVGDSKSPADFALEGARFYSLDEQRRLDFKLASICPVKHYTRKNIGYLIAIRDGASVIVETDDDNFPEDPFWEPRTKQLAATHLHTKGWLNIYSYFSKSGVWPRGLPIEKILDAPSVQEKRENERRDFPIQQGLADRNPDVDAIFRMTRPLPLDFDKRSEALSLSNGAWSPFNSQNTTWFKESFPLLYLPSYCSFRMTDIWRSFVAQRVAWECGWNIVFHNATVYQERNEHNLLRDFEQEVPGYLLNDKIREILANAPLRNGTANIAENLRICYRLLVEHNVITSAEELKLLDAWLDDVARVVN